MEPVTSADRVVIDLTSDDEESGGVEILGDNVQRWNDFADALNRHSFAQSFHDPIIDQPRQSLDASIEGLNINAIRQENEQGQVIEELAFRSTARQGLSLGNDSGFALDDDQILDWGAPMPVMRSATPPARALTPEQSEIIDADDCLRHVQAMFPDIEHDFVHSLWLVENPAIVTGRARFEEVVNQILAKFPYPRQPRIVPSDRKRKRSNSSESAIAAADVAKYMDPLRSSASSRWLIALILKAEFMEMTKEYISRIVAQHQRLFPSYLALARAKEDHQLGMHPVFGRGRVARGRDADIYTGDGGSRPDLIAELQAARRHADYLRRQREAQNARKLEEEQNIKAATAAGAIAECQACFDEMPMNRQIHCDGPVAHFTCFSCAETYINAEVGQSRCRVLCTAGCGAGFAPAQINLLADKDLLARLARIQQLADIRDAGLDDLEECPFCEYKAIMDISKDEDSEFRCAAPDCGIVSCRRCKKGSHLPQTCKEAEDERRLDGRHRIEEAMSAAFVRRCNGCRQQFIKESGCNKMTCPACGNLQCYCCGENVKDYHHFDDGQRARGAHIPPAAVPYRFDQNAQANRTDPVPRRAVNPDNGAGANVTAAAAEASKRKAKCPLYDNAEDRHKRDIEEAERLARAAVLAELPHITAEELAIELPTERAQHGIAGPPNEIQGQARAHAHRGGALRYVDAQDPWNQLHQPLLPIQDRAAQFPAEQAVNVQRRLLAEGQRRTFERARELLEQQRQRHEQWAQAHHQHQQQTRDIMQEYVLRQQQQEQLQRERQRERLQEQRAFLESRRRQRQAEAGFARLQLPLRNGPVPGLQQAEQILGQRQQQWPHFLDGADDGADQLDQHNGAAAPLNARAGGDGYNFFQRNRPERVANGDWRNPVLDPEAAYTLDRELEEALGPDNVAVAARPWQPADRPNYHDDGVGHHEHAFPYGAAYYTNVADNDRAGLFINHNPAMPLHMGYIEPEAVRPQNERIGQLRQQLLQQRRQQAQEHQADLW